MILYSDTVGNFISSCSGSKPIIGQMLLNEFKANHIGGWDTVIRREEYEKLFYNQQATMKGVEGQPVSADVDKEETNQTDSGVKTTIVKPLLKQVNGYGEAMNIDLSKIVVGAKVTHSKFGDGEIVNIDKKDKYLTVRFAVGEKKFVNPDGFPKGFLKFKE